LVLLLMLLSWQDLGGLLHNLLLTLLRLMRLLLRQLMRLLQLQQL
jgi:hypothetical protein